MAIAPGHVSADPAETRDGERVILPTSIYAPGTLVDAQPDGEGAATGAPPHPGEAPGPGTGYPASPPDPGMGQATSPDYGPPSASDPGYEASADRGANPPTEHPYGNYAYVIRDEEPPAPRPRATGPGMRSPGSQPAQEPPQPEPDTAYGPDDPAYGPPSPGWYSSEDQAEQSAPKEPQHARGVFEPPQNQGGFRQDPADDTPPLEQIRGFYLTAEAISTENLDRDFDKLLERQRQLISAYFNEDALQEDPR